MACGLSAYDVALFHLGNNAFFKALLFLHRSFITIRKMYIRGLRFLFRDIPTSDRRSKEITYANNKYEYELRLRAYAMACFGV